ncbi:MAG: heme lyase CcmF/NrfE family subunit [Candidatus Neomarinimicrobiota bacterium]|nr:heme lyase CcmF/NrfE family subunit [Candidatus Neomarinimicrobiota bacterium]
MIPVFGGLSLSLALGLSFIAFIILFLFIRKGDYRFYLSGWRSVVMVSLFSILATLVLLNELIQSNFDVDYVAHYTSLETPLLYKVTALWAGQAGSLLFWLFILSIYCLIVLFQNRNKYTQLMPWVILVLVSIQFFFLIITNFVANPFSPTDVNFIVVNGNGLNPLLQNLTMSIHPPTLYLGYVGFSVPFAFAIAALITGDTSPLWIRSIRRWTLIVWMFQSAGVILGGWWAYQELGWGGYWAWDPVENASFMPWLTGTAFLHSIIIQEKKDMLRIWNIVLITLTFSLCIFGTFLTRSGVMSSVHSFTASNLGPLFLGYVFFNLFISFGLIIYRKSDFRSKRKIESFTSRESGFLFNNVIFVIICFAVFWGTIFPVISEAVTGTKITVGAPFFNQITIPIGLFLLFMTGVGPILVWRRTSKQAFIRNFSLPIAFGLVSLLAGIIIGMSGYVIISFALIGFVTAVILEEFIRGIKSRRKVQNETVVTALISLVRKNRSRYGGYIVHLGIVFMFVGFTGRAFNQELEFPIKKGQFQKFDSYQFEFISLQELERPNHFAWVAGLNVWNDQNEIITRLSPEKRIYFHRDPNPNRRQPHSELSIFSTVFKDIYSIFSGIDIEQEIAYIKIMINPLVWWVWLGGWVLVAGTLIALWPHKE